MFDENHSCDFHVPTLAGETAPLRSFVGEHRDGLVHAAELLAGRRGERIALEVVDALTGVAPLSRRGVRLLHELLDILALEHVDDDTRDKAALFAAIDPDDPIVEEVCLLTDGLRDAIDMADLDHPSASRFSAAA
ncbi:hypothetical protein [Palleronia sp.]|uniref:hypothetical protein n=1 Tax=Palleronia sp. TaxID=1940284 RepID=UPI0035C82802